MARTSSKELTAARRRRADLREHYRRFLETRDGKPYNTLLDDPEHPDNWRGWVHGVPDGYDVAACRCVSCGEAGRKDNQRRAERRIEKRLDEHRAVVAEVLTAAFPGLLADGLKQAAVAVAAAGKVTNRTTAKVTYSRAELVLVLDNWALRGGHFIDVNVIDGLAKTLVERLGS